MAHPKKPAVEFFLEQTDLSLRLARCSGQPGERCVEAIREVLVSDAAALEETVHAIFQGTEQPVIAALRPKSQVLHLATAAEARTPPGVMGVRQFAQHHFSASQTPAWLAATQARDGGDASDTPWLAAFAPAEDRADTAALYQALRLKPGRQLSAIHLAAGALAESTQEPALLLEIGLHRSHLVVIGRAGVMAVRSISFGIEQIAEAVQTELTLKYRGSAQKLFLNEQYDFSESAAGIVQRLAPVLQSELAAVCPAGLTPVALLCSGLPAKQQWFATQLAHTLKLAPFSPDFTTWSRAAGLSFAHPASPAEMPPLWAGFLQMLATHGASPEWNAEWLDVVEAKTAPHAIAPTPTTAPSRSVPSPAVSAPVSATPAAPQPVAVARTATLEVPVKAAQPATAVASVATAPAAVAVKPAAPPAPPPETAVVVAAPAASRIPPVEAQPFYRKTGVFIGAGLAVVVAIGGFFFLQNQREETARIAAEKARAEQQLRDESERARLAEQKVREEAEARKKFEFALNQKLAATEAARAQAENEARTQSAARLANARGRLVVTTVPSGALVTVGALPARPSPVTFDDVRIGNYPVTVTLAGHDSVELAVEIRENQTTEPETVTLQRITGTLEISSSPADSDFELKPANALLLTSADRHTGRTPATLPALPPGDYVVTFSREGWTRHSETIAIARDRTARANFVFPLGSVKITSAPAGASVTQGGNLLGTTPLILNGIAPGDLHYEITMDGFQSGSVQGRLEGNATLELRTALLTTDGITLRSELDSNPVPVERIQPSIPERFHDITARVDIEITVDKTGTPRDAKVVSAPNPEIGKACVAAALRWKFKPALAKGQPVNVRVTLPFNLKPN